ncbi:MAG: hypothetical protein ACK2UJ_16895 [Candidatus Promineifilaceae bacterium]|jgi:heme-degrading monooxygenase HmoA
MAYIYQVYFDIAPEQMNQLEIGASLERVLGYLRTLLPSQMGFISARGMYSLDIPDKTHLVFQSIWESWEDIDAHRRSSLLEDKILVEFEPHVPIDNLKAHIYEEVP